MTDDTQEAELAINYGHGKSTVDIVPSTTLADVRKMILEEFEVDMLPSGGTWGFWVNGMRITVKQEAKKKAWKYIGDGRGVCVQSTAAAAAATVTVSTESAFATKEPSETLTKLTTKRPSQQLQPVTTSSKRTKVEAQPIANEIRLNAKVPGQAEQNDAAEIGNGENSLLDERISSDSVQTGNSEEKKKQNKSMKPVEPVDLDEVPVDLLDCSDAEDDAEEEDDVLLIEMPDNASTELGLSFEKSKNNLKLAQSLLNETEIHQNILTEHRHNQCCKDIKGLLRQKRPQTIIGVYGSTGVGKSSLLNALLDEDSVLPTSGSQGCTAAVVELSFNFALLDPQLTSDDQPGCSSPSPDKENQDVPVYRGEVEFMKKQDWEDELKLLIRECSDDKGRIFSKKPNDKENPPAAAAWNKVNQVYGKGILEECFDRVETESQATQNDGSDESELNNSDLNKEKSLAPEPKQSKNSKKVPWSSERVFQRLCADERVASLLTPESSDTPFNVITLKQGLVASGSDEAREFVKPYAQSKTCTRVLKEQWATAFREQIDAYVYKSGKETDAQTWPLIQKVRLMGPWEVLSTGACFVDLPGVKDVNAARAKVAGEYLEHCSNVWIVAPIKRAVDDGTARELMGEQFKRKLMMDGQYGNISFICTQTDNVEASETMRDHADIAKQTPGLWEKMSELAEQVKRAGTTDNERKGLEQSQKAAKKSFSMARKAFAKNKSCRDLRLTFQKAQRQLQDASSKLDVFQAQFALAKQESKKMQSQLKVLCAGVRNEYSKSRLQEDFKRGLEDMYTKSGESVETNSSQGKQEPIKFPTMDVFCVSANDYLKVVGVKSSSDGPPETFSNPQDTQIPLLRSYVHEATSHKSKEFVHQYVQSTDDFFQKLELFASGCRYVAPNEATAAALKGCFDKELSKVAAAIAATSERFEKSMVCGVQEKLYPLLQEGSKKSVEAAMKTIVSWGDTKVRTKTERGPNRNGLYWSTYQAAVRRNGIYSSKSAGAVDMNQELYDPMEETFATDWERVMDASFKSLLQNEQTSVESTTKLLYIELRTCFFHAGLEVATIDTLFDASKKATETALNVAFRRITKSITKLQRKLTRSMLPKIQKKMKPSYFEAANVPRGSGKFDRMKHAMCATSNPVLSEMFTETVSQMRVEISAAITQIAKSILEISTILRDQMEGILSLSWDFERAKSSPSESNTFRSEICRLRAAQKQAIELLELEDEIFPDKTRQDSASGVAEASAKKAASALEEAVSTNATITTGAGANAIAINTWHHAPHGTNYSQASYASVTGGTGSSPTNVVDLTD